jgi:superfamily I DNA/RNA helicase
VAVTRSKDELYMTYPLVSNESGATGGRLIFRPSRFIQEIPESLYEEWEIEQEDQDQDGGQDWDDEDDRGDMIIDIGLN